MRTAERTDRAGGLGVAGGHGGARCSAATELGGDGSEGREERSRRSGRGEVGVAVGEGEDSRRRGALLSPTSSSTARQSATTAPL